MTSAGYLNQAAERAAGAGFGAERELASGWGGGSYSSVRNDCLFVDPLIGHQEVVKLLSFIDDVLGPH